MAEFKINPITGQMDMVVTGPGGDLLAANNLSDVADAATSFDNIKQDATTAETGVVELATDGESLADKVVQGNDARLSDARTPAAHTITSHSDVVDATGAQLEELSGSGDTTLHDHDGIAENTVARHEHTNKIELDKVTDGDHDAIVAGNPHSVTQTEVGLSNVTNEAQVPLTQKGAANGVASLGADTKIPSAQLPALAITETHTAISEVAQLALTVQEGDVCVRTDENKSYIALNADNVDMGDWQELLTPTDSVTSVFGRAGTVAAVQDDYTHAQLSTIGANDHHSESHTVASHSDTTATGAELETLTDGSNADALHAHAVVEDLTPQLGGDLDALQHSIANIKDLTIGAGVAEDIDLITVNEGTADPDKPQLWWDEATDSFEFNKSLTIPGGSLKIGSITLSEDGGCLRTEDYHAHGDGSVAGYLKLHQGLTPDADAEADHSILWADGSEELYLQNAAGADKKVSIQDASNSLSVSRSIIPTTGADRAAINFGGGGSLLGATSDTDALIMQNAYYNSGYKYLTTDLASAIKLDDGIITLSTAVSGTVDNAITWKDVLKVIVGNVFIGDSSNAKMTQGLTINQGANDDETFALKSSDVSHSMTNLAESDTYFCLKKLDAGSGGVNIRGLSDADHPGLVFQGVMGTANPTNSNPAIKFQGMKYNGTTGAGAMADDETVIAIQNGGTGVLTVLGNGDTAVAGNLNVGGDIIRLETAKTPATASAVGNQGDICWDADYVYVCVATNTWKRSAISTW